MLVVSSDHIITVKCTFLYNFSHGCTVGRDDGTGERDGRGGGRGGEGSSRVREQLSLPLRAS